MDCFRADNLQCIKQDRELFSHLSFALNRGEVLHISGENGAGKTSLLRILAGVSQPQSGSIQWQGEALENCREDYHQALLYLGHKLALNSALSAVENLVFWCSIQKLPDTIDLHDLLGQLGLAGLEDMPVAHLSAGQQRRVSLCRLWLKTCQLLILDEPFNALDVQSRQLLEDKLKRHTDNGGLLIMTSHWQLPKSFCARELALEYNI